MRNDTVRSLSYLSVLTFEYLYARQQFADALHRELTHIIYLSVI